MLHEARRGWVWEVPCVCMVCALLWVPPCCLLSVALVMMLMLMLMQLAPT